MSAEDMYTEKELELLRMRQDAQSRASSGQLQRAGNNEFMPTTGVGVPVNESTPTPPAPKMERMTKDSATAQADLIDQAPSIITDDQKKIAAGAGGLALLGWLASKFMGGDDVGGGGGGGKSPKSRDIRREPQMDTTVKGPQEPAFALEPVVQQAPAEPAQKPQLPQATIAGQQQPQMQYGQATLNAPTGAPNPLPAGPAAPPVEANAPVAPKIPTAEERAHQSWLASEQRKAEEHQKKMALMDAKQQVNTSQKSQGKPVNGLSNDANSLVANATEGKIKADIGEALKTKPVNPLPIGGTNIPVPNMLPEGTPVPAPAPAVQQNTPVIPAPEKVADAEAKLTKEQKGMKNYLVSQYGGGPEGEAAYKKVIDILGEVPAYEKGKGGGLTPEANNAIKDWRKANIEGPKVNLTHDMKKVMKGAGGTAILMALPGFAEAAQRKDVGKMSDIFTDFFVLPFAQSREAGIPKAQEEDIIAAKFKEASKLGSPYRSVPPPKR